VSVESVAERLACFVPEIVRRRVAAGEPGASPAPAADRFDAAGLFADLSGFTALTERLAESGPAGLEALTGILNERFGNIVGAILERGGDVVKFAGDAVYALFPVREGRDLAAAVATAARCGLAIRAAVEGREAAPGLKLSVRVSVSAGDVRCLHVGGLLGRVELLLTGESDRQMARASLLARPGDVVLSEEARALAGDRVAGTPIEGGGLRLAAADPDDDAALPAGAPPGADGLAAGRPGAEAALMAYIPGAVRARLDASHSGWLAELRRVTVIFASLSGVDGRSPLEEAQAIVRELQAALYRFEGSIDKLGADEKGVTLIAALGLPPLAHVDDPARGVKAGLAMKAVLEEHGLEGGIGIATGRVFCGVVGSARRCEYTVLGGAVNLAARLMQAARGGVLCDRTTAEAAGPGLLFDALPPLALKGKPAPVPVFAPRAPPPSGASGAVPIGAVVPASAGAIAPAAAAAAAAPRSRARMTASCLFGRRAERAALSLDLEDLAEGGSGRTVVVEGEAGIGKSHLLADLAREARALGIRVVAGAADAIEQRTPYHAWRGVFSALLGVDDAPDLAERRRRVLARLAGDADLERLAPLLDAVFPLDLPENELTAQMTGQVRAANTHALLVRVLGRAAAEGPLLVQVEDAHWMDSASWSLARVVSRDARPLLLVIATRPIPAPVPFECAEIAADPRTSKVKLDSLPPPETVALVARRLGAAALPEAVARFMCERSQGNPFFAQEIACALRDAGLLVVEGGVCVRAPDRAELAALRFPQTVEGVVTERIDRVSAAAQLTLKVASAIGRVFPVDLLREVHPVAADRARISDHLVQLERLDLTLPDSPEPASRHAFKHVITQEVAYDLMIYAQRRELHRAIALGYERAYRDDLAPHFPLLAHHHARAGDEAKAVDYLERAGDAAVRSFANEEAIAFFAQAIELSERAAPEARAGPHRRAHWEGQIAEACYALSQFKRSVSHFRRALELAGRPAPSSVPMYVVGLIAQAARQVLVRLLPGWLSRPWRRGRSAPAPALLDEARAHSRLSQIYYMNESGLPSVHAAVSALNLAERVGPSEELAQGYANVSITLGLIPLHRLAEAYARRALGTATALGHRPTLAYVHLVRGLYLLGVGDWAGTRDALEQAIAITDRIGDRRRNEESLFLSAILASHTGDIERCAQIAVTLHETGKRKGIPQLEVLALAGRIWTEIACGPRAGAAGEDLPAEAEALLARHEAAAEGVIGRADRVFARGLLALALLRRGERARALESARLGAEALRSGAIASYMLLGLSGLAEVGLALAEAEAAGSAAAAEGLALGRRAVSALRSHARLYAIGRPSAELWRAVSDRAAGKARSTRRAFARSLLAARRLGMPFDEARAHLEIGRRESDEAARRTHLESARDLFARVGATAERARAEALLG